MAVKVHMTINKWSTFVGTHWASGSTKDPTNSTSPMHIWALPLWALRVARPPRLQQRHKGFLLGSPMVWTLIKEVELCILLTAVGITRRVRLSEDGVVLEMLEDKRRNGWKFVSEVEEINGSLWIGSMRMPFVGIQERVSL
ncbi:Protein STRICTOSIDINE SYNTHASE-LIKE 10 [Camellia lanceoleosa]|uniref:Protein STRICTOSIDINE SYNTHASE-LIKE 10 n=1 Tax=Camellia lanceoleosa TaxID=1840588 RepID=A0ACC0FU82_9ERIC|nr:Protein STRICTOSIDINE SYNTHASE-LIKE 10 [Camellia lanceoleosa]